MVQGPREHEDGATTPTGADTPRTPGMPERIGRYRLRSVIATGGMGTVYEAVQEHPRRVVALKLMREGLASKSVLRRFEYESQILARLRHPNIAQVYDAGTHEEGGVSVPYFAMEYIAGARTITEYADAKMLGTRERIALFETVCDAVQHGHAKGIIHRDLKPGNILVGSDGVPKIIDFGVARATDSDMAVTTLQTDVGQLIGTLQYMSPEQVEADPHDLDTRSDVYSLGVVLYELLTGQLPYSVSRSAIHEATRVIREVRPSRMTSAAGDMSLRGDVETITLKAMEKDRDRRYQSARELGEDLHRYLEGRPIAARPASVIYQLSVFARRHRKTAAGIAALFVLLAAGAVTGWTLYVRAERERAAAERRLAMATELFDFMQEEVGSDLRGRVGNEDLAEALMLRAVEVAERMVEESPRDPEAWRRLTVAVERIGFLYEAWGDHEEADAAFARFATLIDASAKRFSTRRWVGPWSMEGRASCVRPRGSGGRPSGDAASLRRGRPDRGRASHRRAGRFRRRHLLDPDEA